MESPRGKITLEEGLKSMRDAGLISVGLVIPQILEILAIVNFGEYNMLVSMILAGIAPLLNRLIRAK